MGEIVGTDHSFRITSIDLLISLRCGRVGDVIGGIDYIDECLQVREILSR